MKTFLIFTVLLCTTVAAQELPDAPKPRLTKQVFKVAVWPGFKSDAPKASRLERINVAFVGVERLTMVPDLITTAAFLSTPTEPAFGYTIYEGNPMMTAFGDRSRAGVLSSTLAWDSALNQLTLSTPRIVQRVLGKKAGTVAYITAIGFSCWRGESHIQASVHNERGRRLYVQRYEQFQSGR